mmetsp:Transcript_79247/g.205926  ORF Transcript_79247/g.205926 Transcript_79247/m.205926 type:complete len:95 (+) Transcript_79247:410-694(+)
MGCPVELFESWLYTVENVVLHLLAPESAQSPFPQWDFCSSRTKGLETGSPSLRAGKVFRATFGLCWVISWLFHGPSFQTGEGNARLFRRSGGGC